MRASRRLLLAAAALALAGPAQAQSCRPDDIAAVIDATGAELRQLNARSQPGLTDRMRLLARSRGWPEGEAEARSYEVAADAETRRIDEQASTLLARLDALGSERAGGDPCARLGEAKAASRQLVDLTGKRAAYVSARLDALLKGEAPAAPRVAAPPAAPQGAAPSPRPQPPPPATAARPPSAAPAPWSTETKREEQPLPPASQEASQAPPRAGADDALSRLPPREPTAAELEFSVGEIQAAGRGFFGTVSASLASVIEYAFQRYGRPNGYVLGNEGGAAFFAGVRYGDGVMVTKLGGERRVYWQGPSIGSDFGIAGSRTMMLVYNLRAPDDILARFGGLDGSAYLVGGVGITFLVKGRVVIAPIRSGVGLRLGANVGYLKFTDQPSLNPF